MSIPPVCADSPAAARTSAPAVNIPRIFGLQSARRDRAGRWRHKRKPAPNRTTAGWPRATPGPGGAPGPAATLAPTPPGPGPSCRRPVRPAWPNPLTLTVDKIIDLLPLLDADE